MRIENSRSGARSWYRAGLLLAATAALSLGGCKLTVTNPGRITEGDLGDKTAAPIILNGLIGDVSYAYMFLAEHGALASDELGFSGTRSWLGFFSEGIIRSNDTNVTWDPAATARWSAEQGVQRLTNLLGANTSEVAQAHLWAGFILRGMGDTFCQAVFDGGAAEPNDAYYTRAITNFQAAKDIADQLGLSAISTAAVAGMAQANLILGNYSDAATEAAQVPDDFVFSALYSGNSTREYNEIWSETYTQSQLTVYGTPIADMGPTGDPRTPWVDAGKLGAGGQAPFYQQGKYSDRGSDIPMAKGWEMRLIEAEVMLRNNDVTGAMAKINHVRDAFGVPEATATTAAEAWHALDHERLVTLWMEGRRLKDNARFLDMGYNNFLQNRDKCFVFSDDEYNSNSNLTR